MMKILNSYYRTVYAALAVAAMGCTGSFLDVKPDARLVVPLTLDDLQALLENHNQINLTGGLGQLSGDEYYYVDEASWLAMASATERNAYVWASDIYEGDQEVRDWTFPYKSIFYANNVLDQLDKINLPKKNGQYGLIRGWAYFVRAYALFDLIKNFAPAYDKQRAAVDLGVPILLQGGIDEIEARATMKACFEQIILDLQRAAELLPEGFDAAKRNRPSGVAAWACLARVYLYMGEYDAAKESAEKALSRYGELLDYNELDLTSDRPFSATNTEVLLNASQVSGLFATVQSLTSSVGIAVDSTLLDLYAENDLRRQAFYGRHSAGSTRKKRGYNDQAYPFMGLATDELYLIRAECLARSGDIEGTLATLDVLLSNRYLNHQFPKLQANTAEEVLDLVLRERRKELVWRGLRWYDLKRLNRDGFGISLMRKLGETVYELQPNDPKWVFPIPDEEIMRSGIEQNQR